MNLFYSHYPIAGTCVLDQTESRHAVKVMRLRKGSQIWVTDGKGSLGRGIITNPNPEGCMIDINEIIPGHDKKKYYTHIAISPLKNPERFDWFVEKAVELGVDEISPVICDHTEKENVKTERLRKIALSAMKQSFRTYHTIINEPVRFKGLINSTCLRGTKLIAHCNEGRKSTISESCTAGSDYVILIGPEGDLSKEEVAIAINSGFIPVTLGPARLRTETAGIIACHSLYFINNLV
jgi:16S rRNA (uracil1498-N3)-methyltransferase